MSRVGWYGPQRYLWRIIVNSEWLKLTQKLPVTLGNSVTSMYLDKVGVVTKDLKNLTSLGPSAGSGSSLILERDCVPVK